MGKGADAGRVADGGRGGGGRITAAPLLPCPYMVMAEVEAAEASSKVHIPLTCVERRREDAGQGCFPLAPRCCICRGAETTTTVRELSL